MSEHDYLMDYVDRYLDRTQYIFDPTILQSREIITNLRDRLVLIQSEHELLQSSITSIEYKVREEIVKSMIR
jgi:hypothetical protein